MARKKKEEIVLNKTELMPTTIGTLDKKENGPIVAIVLIILFVICILCLPYITDWFEAIKNGEPIFVSPSTPSEEKEEEEEYEEVEYYTLSNDLTVTIEGFSFTSFVINANTLQFTLTNQEGNANFFNNHNYFLEFYTTENRLLGRIKLTKETLSLTKNYTYDISAILVNGTPSQIKITEILEEDYPTVSLSTNRDNVPILTCTKDNQYLTYFFTENNGTYELSEMSERLSFTNTEEDYNTTLENYTTLSASFESLSGVSSSLLPTTSGFTFELTLVPRSVSNTIKNRYFQDKVYFASGTEAKVIAFELELDNYTCQ